MSQVPQEGKRQSYRARQQELSRKFQLAVTPDRMTKITEKLLESALKGKVWAARYLFEQLYGALK